MERCPGTVGGDCLRGLTKVLIRSPGVILNHATGILVLFPSTLVAGIWTLHGVPFVVAGFRRSENVAGCAILLVAMLVGWFGLVTAWRLYHALLNGRTDFNRRVAWSGLACGSIVSVLLILASNGTLVFRIGFFSWPLLAAFFYAAWLRCKCPVGARAWRAA